MAKKQGANHIIHMHSPEEFLSCKQMVMGNSQFIFEMCRVTPICYTVFWEEERTKHVLAEVGSVERLDHQLSRNVEVFHRREKQHKTSFCVRVRGQHEGT